MDHYAGLDVSLRSVAICVIDAQGKIVFERSVSFEIAGVVGCLEACGRPLKQIMQALQTIPAEDARAMLESIGGSEDMSPILVERTWLAEHRAKQHDWPAYCAKLRRAFALYSKIGATAMAGGIALVLRLSTSSRQSPPAVATASLSLDTSIPT
ncbi:hypothetical protein [Paracoccus ravus]|uniref:hypothetical protein n=1 Tax=Paracoccus ravus TaxID=2447760 RepID=UPI001430B139|nr:hypothetical protein [Paracoccus ravus]